jgi:hypothetical protein
MSIRNMVGVVALVSCICTSLQGANANSKSLPPGVLKALAGVKGTIEQFLGDYRKGCQHDGAVRFSETRKRRWLQSCQPWSYRRLAAYSFLGSCVCSFQ